jgi:hypothetical protein
MHHENILTSNANHVLIGVKEGFKMAKISYEAKMSSKQLDTFFDSEEKEE